MSQKFFICALCLGLVSCADRTDELLLQLDDALSKKDFYEQNLLDRVNVLREILDETDSPQRVYDMRKRIANEFYSYSLDSTIAYCQANKQLAFELGDAHMQTETDLMMADEYTMAGYYIEAKGLLDAIDPTSLPEDLLMQYNMQRLSLAGETLAYSTDPLLRESLGAEREHYRNLLYGLLPTDTWDWHTLKMEEDWLGGDAESAFAHAEALAEQSDIYSRKYAIACYYCYKYSPEGSADKLQWLVRSATADIMCATKDYASLNELVVLLFSNGDIDRAFRYTADHCMPDAMFFGGKLRPWQIAKFFPEIQRAYEARAARQQKFMAAMIVVLSILVLIIGLLSLVLYRRQKVLDDIRVKLSLSYEKSEEQNNDLKEVNRRMTALNKDLEEANEVKESFIALFLSILSESINDTRQYKNHVLHNIRRGAVASIVEEIEALPPIDEDITEFYKMFDRTFIDLYPNFVEKFNALLRDGEAAIPKGDDLLSPELRIFALIKMGITDSSKIAALLHYSVNTIYNYRAKMKNKAKGDRNKFEDYVKAL